MLMLIILIQITYVSSRIVGKAQKHIIPHLREESINRCQDANKMSRYLESIYNDYSNRIMNIKHNFCKLFMKTTDRFYGFMFKFMYLIVKAGIQQGT